MLNFFMQYGGVVLGALASAVAILLPGIGSAIGCSLVGKTASGLLIEEPEKFGQSLILALLPGSQGLYGFIIGFMIIGKLAADMSLGTGLFCLMTAAPIAFVGYRSAVYQAQVAASGVQVLAKNPKQNMKTVILAALVELYAILALVASLFLYTKIS
jgi:V/A-type H+-transporting ATPase subunit K